MPLLYIAVGFVAGWLVRGGREAPPLPSAREMIALAASGDLGMRDFIALVEKRAGLGDQEAMDTYQNLQDALSALSRPAALPVAQASIPIDSNPQNANPNAGSAAAAIAAMAP